MNDLPDLPFRKILLYLSLEERIKVRGVSRRWLRTIDSFEVKTLCFSNRKLGFIFEKSRIVNGEFERNFIGSLKFQSFFKAYGQSILGNLKNLRLCDLGISSKGIPAFVRTLNSFDQLEELGIFRFYQRDIGSQFQLNLPMLRSLQLKDVCGVPDYDTLFPVYARFTLTAPRLTDVKLWDCNHYLRLDLIPGDSVERATTDHLDSLPVCRMSNLKYLHSLQENWPRILDGLKQLKEINLDYEDDVKEIFAQKKRYGCTDLKVFVCGVLVNGPNDPDIEKIANHMADGYYRFLADNISRLADDWPYHYRISYKRIESSVTAPLAIKIVSRMTDLNEIDVSGPVKDTQRFLDFVKHLSNVSNLSFDGELPQQLYDQLPEHSSGLQKLTIRGPVQDFAFVFRLKHLISLSVTCSIDADSIRRALEELEFLSVFKFKFLKKEVQIRRSEKAINVTAYAAKKKFAASDVNAAVQFIVKKK